MYQNAHSYNSHLTELAQAAVADEKDSISTLLFPPVKVPTAVGSFKKRDIDNAFRSYDTLLARGNSAKSIDVNAEEAFFSVKPHALKVSTWQFDMEQDGGDEERESNLQELLSAQLISREVEAVRIFKAGIPVTSGAGNWSNATSNPVEEINNLILQIHKSIGRMPTHLVIGLQAWSILQNNAKMLSRIGGVDVDVTIERVQRMLVYPGINIVVANLPYQPAARGVKGNKAYVMGADVFCFYTQDAPTRNDMSVAKDFTLTPGGPEVTTHDDDEKMEKVDTLHWSSDRKVTCPAAGARLEIS